MPITETKRVHDGKDNPSYGTKNTELYNLLKVSNGWYTIAEIDNIGAKIAEIDPNAQAGDRYVIDIFAQNTSEGKNDYGATSGGNGGGIDELVLKFTAPPVSTEMVTVEYYKDSTDVNNGGTLLKRENLKSVEIGAQVTASEIAFNKYRPSGYRNGVSETTLPYTVVKGENVIKILYTTNPTVTYRVEGERPEDMSRLPDPVGYDVGATVTVAGYPTTELSGWTFSGWVTEADGVSTVPADTFQMPETDVVFVGRWSHTCAAGRRHHGLRLQRLFAGASSRGRSGRQGDRRSRLDKL